MTEEESAWAMVYPRGSLDPVFVEVTAEDVARGTVRIECGACDGDGVFSAHPDPDKNPPCVDCSTRGYVQVSV